LAGSVISADSSESVRPSPSVSGAALLVLPHALMVNESRITADALPKTLFIVKYSDVSVE
jgi:hypothetical protein